MRIIDSSSNPRIQRVRKILIRHDPNHFLIEGSKLLEEAIVSGMKIEEVFLTQDALQQNANLVQKLETRNVSINRISSRLSNLISDLETPPGMTSILKKPAHGK